ncbi:histidinol-phosphatase [Peptostreptococcus faecalis]|uniref:histidinol-phosphatase n=1 Tax=Peptostreptococcus faecalis TaxID=2045015 RepID=UPI000C7AF814|nr:histidinol-phosphatase [Peptostreptococcus faecalis]
MIIKSTMHNHSTWCDGKSSVEDMVRAAIKSGFTDIGFSSHSHDPKFPESLNDEDGYIREVLQMREKYKNDIRIYCGIEQDYLSEPPRKEYDYIIGSVHYVPIKNGDTFCVDESFESFSSAILKYYDGDSISMVRDYFDSVVDNVNKNKPDIIGHFDLLLKFNSGNKLFDENSNEYKKIAIKALDNCMQIGGLIEINTGGQFRGYRNFPYPQDHILEYLCKYDYPVMINTDCHNIEGIDFGIEDALYRMKKIGFKRVHQYIGGEFISVNI